MPKAKGPKRGSRYLPNKIYGIDFSGARDAGNKIWIAKASISVTRIEIEECYQARYLPNSTTELDRCLIALRQFIRSQEPCVFGLDFPFGLPLRLVEAETWEEFILSFGVHYPNAEKFKQICWETAGNHEIKRETDKNAMVPWCAYNRRIYKQTYYGIRDVLAPLAKEKVVSVLPIQSVAFDKPWLLEVCPASTLKRMKLYRPYKGTNKDIDKKKNRKYILGKIENTGLIKIRSSALRATIIDNPGADALDSVIAALATFRVLRNLARSSVPKTTPYMLEGYVYV